jgi:hypothetical protein
MLASFSSCPNQHYSVHQQQQQHGAQQLAAGSPAPGSPGAQKGRIGGQWGQPLEPSQAMENGVQRACAHAPVYDV